MTVLQMLEQRCDFCKVAVLDGKPPDMAELRKMDVPDDFWDFYFFGDRPEMMELRKMNLPDDFWSSIGKPMAVPAVFSTLRTGVHLSYMAMKRCGKRKSGFWNTPRCSMKNCFFWTSEN